ncbi:MAG: hypothetical protein WC340_17080 [Kiritimatiellia bacterium]
MEEKDLRKMPGKVTETAGGKTLYKPPEHRTVNFMYYTIQNLDDIGVSLLMKRMLHSKSFIDSLVWEVLKSCVSVQTGLSVIKQADMIKKCKNWGAEVSKSSVSESMKRMQSVMLIDNQKVPELVREYYKNGIWNGYIMNPDVVVCGDHSRARRLWKEAGEQKQKSEEMKAKLLTEQTIERVRQRVASGEETSIAIHEELATIKDNDMRHQVRWTVEDAF